MRRLTSSQAFKLIALLQLVLLLSCYAPPQLKSSRELPPLSITKAKSYVRQGRLVQFIDYKMNRLDCTLIGWDENGFIGMSKGRTKKIEYQNLTDMVVVFDQINDGGSALKVGAILGTIACGIIAGGIFSEATGGDHKVPKGLTISFLAVAPITAGIWYLAGKFSDPRGGTYTTYRFSAEDFMNNPWTGQKERE